MKSLNKNYIFSLFFLMLFHIVSAQNIDKLWSKKAISQKTSIENIKGFSNKNKLSELNLNLESLKKYLKKAPIRKNKISRSSLILSFPNSDGELEKFQVYEASVMEESLQNKYPNIKTYTGKGIDNPNLRIRFSLTNMGFHGMILDNLSSTTFIDPLKESNSYLVYRKSSLSPPEEAFQCKFDDFNSHASKAPTNVSAKQSNADDGKLRTFRLAIATTGEYSQFHLDNQGISASATDSEKKEAVLSAIVTTITRVNAIFERDVALTMKLVSNNTDIIFLNSANDGFSNDDSDSLIDESQQKIDAIIGSSNYDIGHTFSTGGGGLAQLNSPCIPGQKAKGITGDAKPIGPSYDIDYVAHEMGHQFGAHHTFNATAGNCAGNSYRGTAVEPGSGSTIMAYSGLCSPYNVENFSDDYFHLVSIREIWANIEEGASSCGSISTINNSAPTIEVLQNYIIPVSTPFQLTANASDVNGDNLTYTWEQLDTEVAAHPLVATSNQGPSFRSIPPSDSETRVFPSMETVLGGNTSNEWEVLPSVSRTMKFGVNVRDNNENGGQSASKELNIEFVNTAGPFKVTSQTEEEEWSAGTVQTVNWDVANTDKDPIYCAKVNILFSEDGGVTFPITLASNVPNNGSYNIVAPSKTTTVGRIKIESVGNVFFNTNIKNISIETSEFVMDFDVTSKISCAPNEVIFNMTYKTFLSFNEETTFTATDLPEGATVSFNPESASENDTSVEMKISGIGEEDDGDYGITVKGTSVNEEKNTAVFLKVFSDNIISPKLNLPENNLESVFEPYSLDWNLSDNIEEYIIEIASDIDFKTIVEASTSTVNNYEPKLLEFNKDYYWRIKGKNNCGESSFSEVFKFTTANVICSSNSSKDTPLNIPDNSSRGVSSIITIVDNKIVTDINVTVNALHEWVGDLTLILKSPSGKEVILSENNGDEGLNYTNTVFDDEADNSIIFGNSPFTGSFIPQESLSEFKNEESYGNWTLKAIDGGPDDYGSIQNWSIEICGENVIGNDDDKDGVINDIDICEFTPLGSEVDDTGCSIFSLPENNFTIEGIGETCPDTGNGQINISTKEAHNYAIFIDGSKIEFTNSVEISGFLPNSYDFCIEVIDESFRQCFSVDIAESDEVSGKTTLNLGKATVILENGTAPFSIFVNNKLVLETDSNEFVIDVKNGDFVEVKTKLACEGIYSKSIIISNDILAYPNPTKGNLKIALPITEKSVFIELYNLQSQLLSAKKYQVIDGKVDLDLSNKATGLYFVKVNLNIPMILKIIKE
ncbi:reprolysin-like metallopeptidase [Lutibacter citreus]|uniref:reprolysin-like metallopeptidase n=1 Tax=Lutibacter citreus TaxID=2138210 RepID=UPI000DBE6FD1|nr:zinc-dependent metalloprotease family protein [Lutibacter citreus]